MVLEEGVNGAYIAGWWVYPIARRWQSLEQERESKVNVPDADGAPQAEAGAIQRNDKSGIPEKVVREK